ncbi:hypothetical protein KGF57_002092 [Candida theae]|uniref:Uncharacterized protein n=1 Tax=Candida theae TaxID=1198502 RepID=A0AAD5BFP5_9ASCO|nr:uncharacterized protein KGF57_002092 [Candida theae]KAI5959454.1 hypothetical protein KGF57_002092 [Candida theae]
MLSRDEIIATLGRTFISGFATSNITFSLFTTAMSEFPTLTLEEFQNAIKDVSQFELESKKDQQRHFIFKLIETNNELLDELHADGISSEDKKLYTETIDENKLSLLGQFGRVESINSELVERGLMSVENKEKEEQNLLDDINKLDKSVQKEEKSEQLEENEETGVML